MHLRNDTGNDIIPRANILKISDLLFYQREFHPAIRLQYQDHSGD